MTDATDRRQDVRQNLRQDRGHGSRLAPLDPELFDPACPSSEMPFRVGDKWTGMIVRCLEGGPRRFGELRVPLRGVTPKVLSETLRAMERDGLLVRTPYDENPPRVEYTLTPLGRTLIPLLDAARAWSEAHLPQLLAARRAHDPHTSGPWPGA